MLASWNPEFPDSRHHDQYRIEPFSMLLIGPSRAGKTYALKHLFLGHFRNRFELIAIVSKTEVYTANYGGLKHLGENVVVLNAFDRAKMQKIVDYQKNSTGSVLLIFDDTISVALKSDPLLEELWAMGRHFGVSIVYLVQKVTYLSTTARANAGIVILWPCRAGERIFVQKEMLAPEVDPEDFKQAHGLSESAGNSLICSRIMKDAWGLRFQSLVLDSRCVSVNTRERVFKYIA